MSYVKPEWTNAKVEPTEEGWYCCLHDGDGEYDDMGGMIYDFGPYIEFAQWKPPSLHSEMFTNPVSSIVSPPRVGRRKFRT